MSISKRLELLLRSELNALRRGSSDEYSRAMKDLRKEFAILRRDEEEIVASIRRYRDQADMWEDRAALALNRNEEDLAKAAINQQHKVLKEVARLRQELEEVREYITKINQKINENDTPAERPKEWTLDQVSNPRITSLGRRTLESPIKRTGPIDLQNNNLSNELDGVTRTGTGIHSDFGQHETFSEFERIADEVEQFEASVEAERLLSRDLPPTSSFAPNPDPLLDPEGVRFEEEYRKIAQQREQERLNDDLAALKAKFREWDDDER